MKTVKIINKILIGLILVTVFFFLVGITYSFFSAGLTGEEVDTTITIEGGDMKVIYVGGPNIVAQDVEPSFDPISTKNFTVTGTNTTNGNMAYKLSIVVVENTFSNNAISFTLESTNQTGNGEVAPSIPDRTGLSKGTKQIGKGKFIGKLTNAVHSYKLNFYFYETGLNQSQDMHKLFKAYIKTVEYDFIGNPEDLLSNKILAQDGGVAAIESKATPDFNVINGTSGLYASEDEYGMSYYYRGLKTELNNNLIFGGFQWKIIRINGDGSIRIIYNGTCPSDICTINSTGSSTQISIVVWNTTNKNDAKYVGYMYGGANGVASVLRNGTTSEAATYNQTDSNAKTLLETWYQNNILGKKAEDYIIDNIFCNDRQLQSEVGGTGGGTGYGTSETIYAPYYRLLTNPTPTLKCGVKNDRFTFSDITKGNGKSTYPIGLISSDEASMAGLKLYTNSSTNYLYTGQLYLTSSPYYNSAGNASVGCVHSSGNLNGNHVTLSSGLRAVLNLDSEITVTGDGSETNPFKVA